MVAKTRERLVEGGEGRVVCGRCDVSVGEEAEGAVMSGRRTVGQRLASVLHLAGRVRDGVMETMGWKEVAKQRWEECKR
jgi:hypothetical protein